MAHSIASKFLAGLNIRPIDGITHLNNAGVGPMCRASHQALEAESLEMSRYGYFGVFSRVERMEARRKSFARILGCASQEVAFFPSVAYGITQAAFGIPLKRGDEILTWQGEYPSNAYAWHAAAAAKRARVKTISLGPNHSTPVERLLNQVNRRTRVIALSWVQFRSGNVTDLEKLAAVKAAYPKNDLWIVVDVIQGLGVMPFNMKTWNVDVVCGGTYKWLCGPMGQGFMAIRGERIKSVAPLLHGAFTYGLPYDQVNPKRRPKNSIHRFEPGAPPLLGVAGAASAIDFLQSLGITSIHAHATALARHLSRELRIRGCKLLTLDTDQKNLQSAIVAFVPHKPISSIVDAFQKTKILHSCPSATRPILRISPHGFNTTNDIARLLEIYDRA